MYSFSNKVSTFAERLQYLKDQRNLTNVDIAKAAGISKANITHYLSGKFEPKQDVVYAIADRYGVSADWLNGLDVPEAPLNVIFPDGNIPKTEIPTPENIDEIIMSLVGQLTDQQKLDVAMRLIDSVKGKAD